MKKIILLVILLVIVGVGYFVFMKKPAVENQQQQINSIPQTTDIVSNTNTSQAPTNTTPPQSSFKLYSKVNTRDTKGSTVSYTVGGNNVIKESRFSFWRITITCTAGITAKDVNGKNICNQSNTLRTSDSFNAIISNANSKNVSVQAKAELLSEKDASISTAQSYVDTWLSPDTQGAINILLPTSNQTISLGTTEKIRFSGIYDMDGKKISISMTPKDYPETVYYLSGLTQTAYPNPVSSVLEFSWEVGKYSHNSVVARPGTLSPGTYNLQITDGTSSSDYITVMIK